MATKATRRIPSELLEYAKTNRQIIKTTDFKEMSKFGELLLVTGADTIITKIMSGKMSTLAVPFDTELTGRQIACGLSIHKTTTDADITNIKSVVESTIGEVSRLYKSMTTTQPRSFNKRVSNTKRVPNATQPNPSRQVRSFSLATTIGKDILLTRDVDDRATTIIELAEEFSRRGLAIDSPEVLEFGVSDNKVLSQLCMNPTKLSPKDLESALIMAAIKEKENHYETNISISE